MKRGIGNLSGTFIIKTNDGMIACSSDFRNMSQEEITHFITELEIAKQKLLMLFETKREFSLSSKD